ncbi:MAG: PP2C family protein-serine/threonine phosphatase, partial [Mangrovibacterium sp.]
LNYCNAAHNYPFLVTSDRKLRQLDSAHGLPIGIYPGKSYSGETVVLREGDMLVLYTDGVTDCKDASDNSYGVERLEENISNMMELSAEEVVNRISTSLNVFRGSNPQVDDISLMAIRYLSRKN